MKVIINNAEMVPTPKKGTIIRFGDCGLFVIGIYVGPSCPNPGIRRELEAQGKPYMCTSDIATWIGVDNKWYYVYRPGVSTSIIPLLELTKDEDEMFDYLKDISEFGHENPHN